jgi:hypothetical protein
VSREEVENALDLLRRQVDTLEGRNERIAAAVNAHAELLRSMGALIEVLGVSVDDEMPVESAPGTRPAPPPSADR